MKREIIPGVLTLGARRENIGQLWALVLTTDAIEKGDGNGAADPTDPQVPKQSRLELSAALPLVRDALNRAAAVAHRTRICVVITPEHYLRVEPQLWHLLRSNVLIQSEQRGTAHGVLFALLRILQRDAAARMVLLPSTHEVRDEISLRGSLRYAAAHTALRPQVLGNTRILAGPAREFLQLIERRLPDIVRQARAAVAQDQHGREDGRAAADLSARLRGLDFYRDVLAGQERYLSIVPVPRRGYSGTANHSHPGTNDQPS